ncbi:GDSL-type esterase/lipase family protein [Candidatus Contubernalis alkaliaceticus]|uniref:GDSL-type esterase/lipase family protein n=1 Tax=Candidatus Contubernalis alkaliaceticus TaxID=338645 RepID=UPI001F4C3F0E|nr:GDSL-type esterase/lipase family protein [Candidatus Contubernalis alkalaceticus]UNC91881.1 GDSL family lipase [Candidatus Contubernalis alkalaceticus]
MSKGKMKIVALGDSITYGFPYSPQESWVAMAGDILNMQIINQGDCGDTTSFMLYRFFQSVVHYKPTHVIIMGGVNDAFSNISPGTVGENIIKMCNHAEEAKIRPIIGLPTPVNEKPYEHILALYRERMSIFAEERGIKIIDFYRSILDPETGGIQSDYHVDGVHPSLYGYEAMTQAVKKEHFIE